jgi:uncharacterized protein YeaO (DUF488 family)
MLKNTYKGNVPNVRKENPGAEIIEVTRSVGHVLSPSRSLLDLYRAKAIDWDEYVRMFVKEMAKPECIAEMKRIGELAKTREVYLVCFERVGHCHRFLLMDMIGKLVPGAV